MFIILKVREWKLREVRYLPKDPTAGLEAPAV